jgi:hypothetical protein
MANKIALVSCGRQDEALAAAALSPGHLIAHDSTGKVAKHATEGGFVVCAFAEEDALQGKTVADAYASGDFQRGDIVNALLKAGVSYAKGDKLISAGDGTLKKQSAATTTTVVKQIVGEIRDALDLSASGAVAAKSAVRLY